MPVDATILTTFYRAAMSTEYNSLSTSNLALASAAED